MFRRLRRFEGDTRAFQQVVKPPSAHIVPMKRVRLPILPAERSYTMVTLQPCDLTRHVSHLVNLMVDLLEEVPKPRLKNLPADDRAKVGLLKRMRRIGRGRPRASRASPLESI